MDALGLPEFFESSGLHISGLVVANYSADHSHWASMTSLGEWLEKHNIPGICGIDTRAITKVEPVLCVGQLNYFSF